MKLASRRWILGVVVALAALITGCPPEGTGGASPNPAPRSDIRLIASFNGSEVIRAYHDDAHSVTCWTNYAYKSGGIFCLPDSALAKPSPESAPASLPAK